MHADCTFFALKNLDKNISLYVGTWYVYVYSPCTTFKMWIGENCFILPYFTYSPIFFPKVMNTS